MYKAVKKTKTTRRYMEALALHTGAPTVYWDDNTSCISGVGAKGVTTRVKHIDITVCFLQLQFDNGILFQNMRSLVLCLQICAPKYVQVQLSVGLLNG